MEALDFAICFILCVKSIATSFACRRYLYLSPVAGTTSSFSCKRQFGEEIL